MASKGKTVFSEEKNPRGIPKAPFIADVEEYLGGKDGEAEPALKSFQEAIAKYRYMETSLTQRRANLEEKIPDIKKTLDMVEYMQERREGKGKTEDDLEDDLDEDTEEDGLKKPLKTTFELNDTLYAEAELEETDTVYLWLGANVMLSYKIPAAVTLLQSKLRVAETSLNNTIEDLEFLREQLTIMEVNTARVYNWDVKRRREKREQEASKK
ncbi:prefoldin subunit [Crepidotus variabilis]|uniref:Prefoldin subunit 3 n=1 Tax=Crepidotus variabilis TaxID=179855 RepID=A0A9P6JJ37_9AGAR|nr:prefoldin subunit [Crepidotus variabilis]